LEGEPLMAKLKDRLREIRKKHKLTQKDMGNFLNISESAYGYYEQGRNDPSIESLRKIAEHFEVTVSYLTGDSDDPSLDKKDNINIAFLDGDNLTEDEKKHLEIALEIYRAHNKKKNDNEEK
jgi:transcriptional regulator with XRE-family HTH domain